MSVQQEIMTVTSHFELPVLTWRVAMTVNAGLAMEGMALPVFVRLNPLTARL